MDNIKIYNQHKSNHKKHKRNNFLDFLAYLGLRVLVLILSLFSMKQNLRTARFLGRLLWDHYHRGRKRAINNLKASFSDKSNSWIEKTGKKSFEEMAMLAVDVIFTPRLVKKKNWRKYATFKNTERAKWMMKENKPLIMVAAHYSNFEIMGYLMGLFGFNIYSIARPLDNKYINKYLFGVREKVGQKVIDKKGAAAHMARFIKENATICFIADQDAGRKGIFVDFFGRPASTYKSIALLAVTENIPIGVGYSRRINNKFFFEIGIEQIITPEQWENKKDPIKWVTAEYTKAIENFVKKEPSQYWWLHRRWKHAPKTT